MSTLVTFAKTKWFVYAGSEIYGGLANSWDYGPLGSMLKENIKNLWIKNFVQKRKDMVLLDAAILMNPQVWVASGHVGGFSDPLVDCKACKTRHRADKILEEKFKEEVMTIRKNWLHRSAKEWVKNWENLSAIEQNDKIWNWDPKKEEVMHIHEISKWESVEMEEQFHSTCSSFNPALWMWARWILNLSKDLNQFLFHFMMFEKVPCPECWKVDWTEIRNFNLMFKTFQWVTDDSSSMVYMRPETAQGIFVNFPNIARSSRKKVPFGVAQVGKAFRNEITPGNFIFRTREFEQMEIEYFCEPESVAPGKHLELHSQWKAECNRFLIEEIGLKEWSLRLRDHEKEELSHYSAATTDIEFRFPFGWGELWGIADRTDFDLKAHMAESKQDLSYFDPFNNTKYIPYVIEPSVGLTRLFLATLTDAYDEVPGEEWTSKVIMRFTPAVAPIKVWVFPLVKKFSDQANALYDLLSEHFVSEYDEAGTIGKRYQRADEIGIPYSICVEPENYDQGQVTVRDRDSGEQEIVKITDLVRWLQSKGC